jgi:hypothetical protein
MNPRQFDIHLSPRSHGLFRVLALVGVLTFVVGLLVSPQRAWANLLLVSFALLGIGLGGAFFIALQYLCGAGWAVAVRRVPEAMCKALPVGAIGIMLVLLFRPSLYPWVDPAEGAHAITGFKAWWLSRPFFLMRSAFYLLSWILLAGAMVRNSRRQDADGDHAHTRANVRLAAVFTVLYAITLSLASFDWIMSLEPEWYSTIFGVYNFAGMFVAALSVIVLGSVWLQRTGPFRSILTEEHLHDLAKLILAFSTFWAYIWFSQYMLIWYANNPEETGYYIRRQHGAWFSLFMLNFFLNWAVPFFVLLSRRAKRNAAVMVKVALLLLVGRWLDLYLMIMPPLAGTTPPFGPLEIGLAAGGVALFVLIFTRALRAAPLVPMRDPYVLESLYYHQ